MTDKQAAKLRMAQSFGAYVDGGELQCTQLAEDTAYAMRHEEWLNDSHHWIWDLPIQLGRAIGLIR